MSIKRYYLIRYRLPGPLPSAVMSPFATISERISLVLDDLSPSMSAICDDDALTALSR